MYDLFKISWINKVNASPQIIFENLYILVTNAFIISKPKLILWCLNKSSIDLATRFKIRMYLLNGEKHLTLIRDQQILTSFILCSHIFLVLRDHWLYVCLQLKMEFRSCARGRQWCSIFRYHWWTASIKPRLQFSHSDLVSWGLPFLHFKYSANW